MGGALLDVHAERAFIEASDDPAEILGWMREYRAAQRETDDDDACAELDELIAFAEDRVVALKAERLAPKPKRGVEQIVEPPVRTSLSRLVDAPPRASVQRCQAESDDAALHQLRERARRARERQAVAEAETARLKEAQVVAAKERVRIEQERARRREQALRHAQEHERAAAFAEAEARAAAQAAPRNTSPPAVVSSTAPPEVPPTPTEVDLPPLTGADLVAFRTRRGLSQRTLAATLGVEQGTISKGESKAAAVLGPALRAALHKAMGERGDEAGKAP